jgi:hypothetical protein
LPHQQEAPCKVFPVQLLPKTTKKEAKVRLSDRNSWSPFFECKMIKFISNGSLSVENSSKQEPKARTVKTSENGNPPLFESRDEI